MKFKLNVIVWTSALVLLLVMMYVAWYILRIVGIIIISFIAVYLYFKIKEVLSD